MCVLPVYGKELINPDQRGDSNKTDIVSSPDHMFMKRPDGLFNFAGSFMHFPDSPCFTTDMTVVHGQNLPFVFAGLD